MSDSPETSIGSHANNTLRLEDSTVSRFHCQLVRTDKGLLVRDLDSKNGTFLNSMRIHEAMVPPAGHLRVGETEIEIQLEPSPNDEATDDVNCFGQAIGRSPAMLRLTRILEKVAPTQSTVLLLGETGTGKSLLAKLIHQASARANESLITVDCAALPPTLIESELFGHERGAFTNAETQRVGAFELAHRGSLFLDEIGELPLPLQPKFLRAIEHRRVKPVGGSKEVPVDIRLIVATNRNLKAMIASGDFRSDLYYRLNVVALEVPPLRERPEDIPELVDRFTKSLLGAGSSFDISAQELESMRQARWPGNVRELRTALERAIVTGDRSHLLGCESAEEPTDSRIEFEPWRAGESFRDAKRRAVSSFERHFLDALLPKAKGNVSAAARIAEMDRNYLRTLIARYDRS